VLDHVGADAGLGFGVGGGVGIEADRYSLSELDVSGSMSFSAQEYKAEGYSGFVMPVGSGMKWSQSGFCGYPGVVPITGTDLYDTSAVSRCS
jgi:hypothetical protein